MQIAYSPDITRRNIALVLWWTGTPNAFNPFTYLLKRASSFHWVFKPESIELSAPPAWIVERNHSLVFRVQDFSQPFGKSAGLIFFVL
jgi:hypothetical protein